MQAVPSQGRGRLMTQMQKLVCDTAVIQNSADSTGSSALKTVLRRGPKLYPCLNQPLDGVAPLP